MPRHGLDSRCFGPWCVVAAHKGIFLGQPVQPARCEPGRVEKATTAQSKTPATGSVTASKPTDCQAPTRAEGASTQNLEGLERQLGVGAGRPGKPHCVESCAMPLFSGWRRGSHASGSGQDRAPASLALASPALSLTALPTPRWPMVRGRLRPGASGRPTSAARQALPARPLRLWIITARPLGLYVAGDGLAGAV